MPELPEVETVARSLGPEITGRRVLEVRSSGKKLRVAVDGKKLRAALVGHRLDSIERRGKYLVIRTSGPWSVLVHLGMSGRMVCVSATEAEPRHTHVVWRLEGDREVRLIDPRRFGLMKPVPSATIERSDELAEMGPDPFSVDFSTTYLRQRLSGTRRDIKSFLLDQREVAGIGNIYASEALHEAGIAPGVRCDRLSAARADRLRQAVVSVLARAVHNRGTTLRDYVDGRGAGGENQHALAVYGRQGEPCRRCGRAIRRRVQGQRATYSCPGCQR